MATSSQAVSDAELDVLKVLWEHGPGTVRQIEKRLPRRRRRWAYNTLLTLLSRLRTKGCVVSATEGTAHVFRAVVSRQTLLQSGLTELAQRMCDGTASPLVHALVEGGKLSEDDIAYLRKVLDQLERKE